MEWTWQSGSDGASDVPSTEYETTGSPEDGYQSTLITTETDTENTIIYHCRAALDIDSSVQQNEDTVVTVIGKDVPYMHVYLPCVHPRVQNPCVVALVEWSPHLVNHVILFVPCRTNEPCDP